MPSELCHPYQLDESISKFRGVWYILLFLFYFDRNACQQTVYTLNKCRSLRSLIWVLHCLHRSKKKIKKETRQYGLIIIWVYSARNVKLFSPNWTKAYSRTQHTLYTGSGVRIRLSSLVVFSVDAWAATWQNQQNYCAPSDDSDPTERTANTLIRLGGCPGWSESSLGAQSLCWFCHAAAHMCITTSTYFMFFALDWLRVL